MNTEAVSSVPKNEQTNKNVENIKDSINMTDLLVHLFFCLFDAVPLLADCFDAFQLPIVLLVFGLNRRRSSLSVSELLM